MPHTLNTGPSYTTVYFHHSGEKSLPSPSLTAGKRSKNDRQPAIVSPVPSLRGSTPATPPVAAENRE